MNKNKLKRRDKIQNVILLSLYSSLSPPLYFIFLSHKDTHAETQILSFLQFTFGFHQVWFKEILFLVFQQNEIKIDVERAATCSQT